MMKSALAPTAMRISAKAYHRNCIITWGGVYHAVRHNTSVIETIKVTYGVTEEFLTTLYDYPCQGASREEVMESAKVGDGFDYLYQAEDKVREIVAERQKKAFRVKGCAILPDEWGELKRKPTAHGGSVLEYDAGGITLRYSVTPRREVVSSR